MAEFGVGYTLEDAYGRVATKRFTVAAADHATAVTEAGNMAVDLAGVSEAQILWYTVQEKTVYSDSADAGANKDEGITLVVRKADNEKAVIKVPAPINAAINPDGTVDLANALVLSFTNNFTSGVFRISDHEVVTEVLSGTLDK